MASSKFCVSMSSISAGESSGKCVCGVCGRCLAATRALTKKGYLFECALNRLRCQTSEGSDSLSPCSLAWPTYLDSHVLMRVAYTQKHTSTHTQTQAQTHNRTNTHKHTHTHARAHMHTLSAYCVVYGVLNTPSWPAGSYVSDFSECGIDTNSAYLVLEQGRRRFH